MKSNDENQLQKGGLIECGRLISGDGFAIHDLDNGIITISQDREQENSMENDKFSFNFNVARRKVYSVIREVMGNDCLEILKAENKQVIRSLLDLSDYLDMGCKEMLSPEGRCLEDDNSRLLCSHKRRWDVQKNNQQEDSR